MKLVVFSKREGVQLVGHWNSVPSFFDDWENLFEFSEVLEYSYASLGNSVDDSSLAYGSFFDELLFDEEVQVLLKYTAIYVSFVHDVSELQWAPMG